MSDAHTQTYSYSDNKLRYSSSGTQKDALELEVVQSYKNNDFRLRVSVRKAKCLIISNCKIMVKMQPLKITNFRSFL